MLHGQCLGINLADTRPNFTAEYAGDDSSLPSWVFNYEECEKFENYTKIVREDENRSLTGDPGNYFRNAKFSMVMICTYVSDEEIQSYLQQIPHSEQFEVYVI